MSKGLRPVAALILLPMIACAVSAQRPRTMNQEATEATTKMPAPSPAPQTVKAKYEGGVFGYNKKLEGTLSFDDSSQRLVFRDGKQKEVLFIPYNAITGAYGDTHAVQPSAATIASHIPYVGLPASFIKTKVRYLALQYDDPDSKVAGVTSFRLENRDILDSVLYAVANKSALTKRGDVYIKKRE